MSDVSMDALSSLYQTSGAQLQNPTMSDKNLFLKMYVAEIANQDPTNPVSSDNLAQQMSQFASMESMNSIKSSLEQLVSLSSSSNLYNVFSDSLSLVGRTVEVKKGDATASGEVSKVFRKDDGIYLVVNGENYEFTDVVSVKK